MFTWLFIDIDVLQTLLYGVEYEWSQKTNSQKNIGQHFQQEGFEEC